LSDTKIEGAGKLPLIEQIFFDKRIDFNEYDYLIFTSKNGVIAADKISNEWKEIKALAIGNATAKMVRKLGGKLAYKAKKFYGDEFAKEIAQNFDKNKRFLYLRAKKVLSNLTGILKNNGFKIDEEIVYETKCAECKNLKAPDKYSFIIFSSPSTVKCFFKCFKWDESYKAVAIGKKTASYIPSDIDYIVSSVQTLQGTVDFVLDFI